MEMLNSNFWTPKISVPSIEILNWRQIIDNNRVKKKIGGKAERPDSSQAFVWDIINLQLTNLVNLLQPSSVFCLETNQLFDLIWIYWELWKNCNEPYSKLTQIFNDILEHRASLSQKPNCFHKLTFNTN